MKKNVRPTVSVILPVYNTKMYIKESVESILQQTFSDFELLIIDDASTDGTQDIIKGFIDNRIVFIQKEKNSGYTQSLNSGIEFAKGKYIARMDADDISLPQRLEKQVAFLEAHEEVVVCGADAEIIGSNERFIPFFLTHEEIITSMLITNPMIHPVIMFRRSFLLENNIRYNESFEPAEDFELWVRIASIGKLANLPDVLLRYRKHTGQVSNTRNELQQKNVRELRIELVKYLTGILTPTEYNYTRLLFELRNASDKEDLGNTLKWASFVVQLNTQKKTFHHQLFEKYISILKKRCVRVYFHSRNKYGIKNITELFLSSGPVRQNLGSYNIMKFIVKCFLFWKQPKVQ